MASKPNSQTRADVVDYNDEKRIIPPNPPVPFTAGPLPMGAQYTLTTIEKPSETSDNAVIGGDIDLGAEPPRSSGSTSASPCSFGHSIATADPLVDPAQEGDSRPTLTGRPLILLIAGLLTSAFILALDQMIIATALPVISSTFNSLAQLPWVVNGFFLTQATSTLTFGQLYTFLSAKNTFLFSILLFEIGSILSAAAPTFWVLILGRAVSGLGAGGLVVGMHTIVGQVVRLQDRTVYYSSLGVVFSAASIGGPTVGGVLTDKLSWRYCFWVNLPFGAIGAIAVYFALPAYQVRLPLTLRGKGLFRHWLSIDWIGNVFALGMTTSLMLALQWGGSVLPWNDRSILALFTLAGVLLGLFLWWEIHTEKRGLAMVPLKLLQNRSVSGAAISGFFVHILFGVLSTYLPLLYQSRGASALQSGINILPFLLTSIGFVIISGGFVKRVGYYKFWIVLGPWIASVGAGLLTDKNLLNKEFLIGSQVIVGAGFGMAFQNTMMAVQAEYAPDNLSHLIPQATSIVGFFQRTGPMIGVSIAGAIFANNLDHRLSELSFPFTQPQIDQIRQSVEFVWSGSEKSGFSDSQRDAIVDIYVDSVRRALFVLAPTAVVSGAAALLVKNWNIRKRGRP